MFASPKASVDCAVAMLHGFVNEWFTGLIIVYFCT
jgi:hypothetical protein